MTPLEILYALRLFLVFKYFLQADVRWEKLEKWHLERRILLTTDPVIGQVYFCNFV